MADDMNKVILIGNVGSEPDLRFTTGGRARLRLRLATGASWKDEQGELKERTDWHTVIVWGKRAEALGKILEKGKRVGIEGSLRHRSWQDPKGEKQYAVEVVASDVLLLDARRRDGARSSGEREGEPPTAALAADDVPF